MWAGGATLGRTGPDTSSSPSAALTASASPAASASPTPTPQSTAVTHASASQSKRWGCLGYDRSYKADLLERLKKAPELVVLGGSRAQRFAPSTIARLSGLSAFNFAVHNCRTYDAYAISRYLIARSPTTRLRCIFALQATTLVDTPMDQALLYDRRFSQWFPTALTRRQKSAQGTPQRRHVPSADVYSSRGLIISNGYDRRLAEGVSLDTSLSAYIASVTPRAASSYSAGSGLSRFYLRKLLKLYNDRGVTPLLVLMPYHPSALKAFREVGWQHKLDAAKAYLARLHRRYGFRVLDYTSIRSFGGKAKWFYDGAHVTKQNADRILAKAVAQAPECLD
jgi:hypothetical protein